MCSRENKRKTGVGGVRYTHPVKTSYRSSKTKMNLRTSAFNPSPANVNQDDLLLKHMEAHYRRVTSAKGRTDTSIPESLLKCTKVRDHAKRHSDHMYNSNLQISEWSSSQSSLRTARNSGVLKMTPSHASSKSDAGFVSMATSLDSLHMADEELDGGGNLSTRNYYLPSNKGNVHPQDNLFAFKRDSECNLKRFSTSFIDHPGMPLKYRNLLEFPVKEDTKWQLYHTKTGQLTGYLHYKQRSSPCKCPPSPASVPTSPWKPAFSTNSTSFSSLSKSTALQSSQSELPPHPRKVKGKCRNRKAAELQPQDESSLGKTHILNKTFDRVSPSINSAGTSMKIGPETPLQTDPLGSYSLHEKPPAKESTSQHDYNTGEQDSNAKARTDERQSDHQGTQDIATTSASLPTAQREPGPLLTDEAIVVPAGERGPLLTDEAIVVPAGERGPLLTDEAIVVPAGERGPLLTDEAIVVPAGERGPLLTDEAIVVPAGERGRELIDMTAELSLQAHALNISSLNVRRRLEEEKRENEYLEFIAGVTRDIVARGVLSDSAMALLFKSHIERNRHRLRMDIMLEKIHSLKKELGTPS